MSVSVCPSVCMSVCVCVHVCVRLCVCMCAFPWNKFPFKSLVDKYSSWESSACHCSISPVTVEHSLQDCKTAESVHSSMSELPEFLSNWPHDSWVTFPSACESLFWLCSCQTDHMTAGLLSPALVKVCFDWVLFLSNWPHDGWVTFPSAGESLFWLGSVSVKLTTWQLGYFPQRWWKFVWSVLFQVFFLSYD